MKPDWRTCRPRTAEGILDRLSRTRALTLAESIGLERAIKAQTGELLGELVKVASKSTDVAVREITSKCTCQRVSRVRAAVILAAREKRLSLPTIARFFDHKDHTSAWNASQRAVELEASDPAYARLLKKLRAVE